MSKTTTKEALEPCPLCRSTNLFLRDIGGWEIDCRDCELSLVLADDPSREGLVKRWNTRVSAAPIVAPEVDRPKIICLCGSTRFIEQFAIATWELERQGYIVLGCTLLPMWYCKVPSHFGEATGTKEQCDELHLRKIDLADEVLVLNIGGYIGESTQNEITYATKTGKPIRYLESESELPAAPASTVAPVEQSDDTERLRDERERAIHMLIDIEQREVINAEAIDAHVVIAQWERDFLCKTVRQVLGESR